MFVIMYWRNFLAFGVLQKTQLLLGWSKAHTTLRLWLIHQRFLHDVELTQNSLVSSLLNFTNKRSHKNKQVLIVAWLQHRRSWVFQRTLNPRKLFCNIFAGVEQFTECSFLFDLIPKPSVLNLDLIWNINQGFPTLDKVSPYLQLSLTSLSDPASSLN